MHHHATAGAASDLQLPVDLIGTGPSIRRAADVVRRAAGSGDTVLIVAEPGFNPERIARAIHHAGAHASRPFISIDCGDTPAAVVQRLFGAERKSRSQYETVTADSALAEAGEGTIFLADVSEMPAAAQLRLSRLLRDGEMRVRRSTAQVRFRLMASAAPGLGADVHQHRFRPELYRRLQRLRVDVPPLRDRSGDLPALIDAVLAEISASRSMACTLTPAARTALAALRWAGNIDELRDALARLLDRCDGSVIRQEDVLADLQHTHARPRRVHATLESLREARQTFEREYISTVLEEYGWRMTEAARVLGIERANLYRKTRQLGITRLKPSRAS
jgi:DNA-binding NtrC family response regulator